MCGRYGFTADQEEMMNRFDLESWDFSLRDSYNVAPSQEMPVVERHSPNSLHLRQWGIQPAWSNRALINAQAEKLAESRVWVKAFRESRCIVPANFFYEWKVIEKGKQPYLIQLKSKELFGFAGLVVNYHDDKKQEKKGYVIITTEPNSLMKEIHRRMPVILRREDEDEWLNPDNVEPEKLLKLLKPYESSEMEAYPVSSQVNSPSNNNPTVVNKVDL